MDSWWGEGYLVGWMGCWWGGWENGVYCCSHFTNIFLMLQMFIDVFNLVHDSQKNNVYDTLLYLPQTCFLQYFPTLKYLIYINEFKCSP